MSTRTQMSGPIEAIGDVATGLINWISGANAKAERAARAAAEAEIAAAEAAEQAAQYDYLARQAEAQAAIDAASLSAASNRQLILLGGGLAIAALLVYATVRR